MDKFEGKWQVTTTENMYEMLKAFDMDENKRQMYCKMNFTMEYQKSDGDTWLYTVYMPHNMSKSYTFAVGQEFDSTTLDGRPIKSRVEIENDKFVEYHKDANDPGLDAKMVREIVNGELVVTATVKNITSVTRHKRVA